MLVVFAAIAGSPFVLWRVPDPQNDARIIAGSVYHQVLDEAPDLQHRVRTQFESLFGNKAVTLVDGPRLYVSEADYKRCWPESWEQIYTKGYSLRITAETKPLL